MRTAPLPAFVALALLPVAAAAAQPTFDGRIAFRDDHTVSTVANIPNGGDHLFNVAGMTPPFTFNFAVMLGVFNAQGFDNHGIFAFEGSITTSMHPNFTLGNTPGARGPFNFSPAANGTVPADGFSINNVDLVRNPLVTVPWPDGVPAPGQPLSNYGRDQYFSAFRFTLTLHERLHSEVQVNVNGVLTALAGWNFLGGEEGDSANWVAGPFVSIPVSGSFTMIFLPGPTTLAPLALAGLVATRRRRPM